jgi:hypothetical protein
MDRLPVFLADALQAYRTEFVALPMPRIALDTYLVRDKVEWATLTMQVMGREAGAVTGLARGGVTTDAKALLYDIGPADTFAIAAHEGWHQFTQASFAEQLPAWLEEGLGTYFEGFRWAPGERAEFLGWCNPGRFDALKTAAIEGRLLPLGVLLESSPGKIAIGEFGEALTYYAQAWALVHFLREGEAGRYRPGLERIIADAAAGTLGSRLRAEANIQTAQNYGTRTPGSAAWAVYFGDVASAESSFHAFIESVVQPSGRRRIVEGRSPIDQ